MYDYRHPRRNSKGRKGEEYFGQWVKNFDSLEVKLEMKGPWTGEDFQQREEPPRSKLESRLAS